MSDIIEQIRAKLAKFPQARVEFDQSSITVWPNSPEGFTVRLEVRRCGVGEHYTICYNGSREEVAHYPKAAIKLFAFGLSTDCRLREYWRRGRAYRWIVETWSPQRKRWEADWDVIRWFAALSFFWRRPTVRCLQNHLLDLDAGDGSSLSNRLPKP